MNKKVSLTILIILLTVIIALFVSASSLLTKEFFSIPFGNILVWIGFISLQLFVYIINNGFKRSKSIIGKTIKYLMIALIIISVFWFGLAYILSGNTSFNFNSNSTGYAGSPKASILYWNIIYTLVIAPLILMISYSLLRFFERLNQH
ncbi:hypothetical protein FBALC1_14862 [Flavobacteriales bacterium ALC-1]|nr:hypothetical protein FBALC1_14862 [Flavobacteriales bacterium ALC-1]